MIFVQFLKRQIFFKAVIIIGAITLMPILGAFAEGEKKSEPTPLTTNDPKISQAELAYRVDPLTKDDLAVEANGWLQIIKEHVAKVSEVQIQALTAEGDDKTKLLESVNKLKEEQTALIDRLKVVTEELKAKGGKIEDYN